MSGQAGRTPRIFISYARADGEAFARVLHRRLTDDDGLAVWLDRIDMEGGRDWWEQIAAMLRAPEAQHLLPVLTPAAVASPVVRREWRYALQEGMRVTPVIDRANKPASASLPRIMQRAHRIDPAVDEDWRHLVRLLEGPSNQVRVPFMAGDFPAGFVARPEAHATVKRALLDQGDAVTITAALRGAGGFGKTTLARALCHDGDIQDAFHHGVLWTTLGETPGDIVGRLNTLTRALDPDAKLESDHDLAVAEWRKALDQRRCLIVIDDVWRAADLKPFLQGGPDCARLVTTRDAGVLPAGGVARVPVDAMMPDEAVALLARHLPEAETAAHRSRFAALAAALGEWPLLLDLANARLRSRREKGADLVSALDHVEEGIRRKGIAAFDATRPEARNEAAARSLDLSVEALVEDEGADAALRLEALAVFIEDADVPIDLATALRAREAGLDPFDGDLLLDRIADLSFFASFDRGAGALRLHDVVRSHLRTRLGPGRLRVLDGLLAGAMRERAGPGWSALRTDAYAVAHLPAHLWGAGDAAALDDLLTDAKWLGAALDAHRATGAGCAPLIEVYGRHARTPSGQQVARMIRSFAHELSVDGSRMVASLLLGCVDDEALRARWRRSVVGTALAPLRATMRPPDGELLRLMHRHSVRSVAFSPDGTRLATGSADETVRLWDAATGREISRLEGHEAGVTDVMFSPDGALLASGSWDHTVRLWDVAVGCEVARFEVRRGGGVNSVAFSSDGSRLAAGSHDGTARLWDVATEREVLRLEGHRSSITCVAFSPDGARLASASEDLTTRLWDVVTGGEIALLGGHERGVKSVAYSPDGARLATGSGEVSGNGTARLWDAATAREIARFDVHEGSVRSVAFSPDGMRLATGSWDQMARLWDVATGNETTRFAGHAGPVGSVAFSPDGARLATGSGDGTARIWDVGAGREPARREGHSGRVGSVAFFPDGVLLATASHDSTVRLWQAATGREIARLEGHSTWVTSVAFSPDGARSATGGQDFTALLWDATTRRVLVRLEGHEDAVTCLSFSPDGTRLATGSEDGTARVWDAATGREIASLDEHRRWVRSVAFAPNGSQLATGSGDGTVRLWDVATWGEVARLGRHEAGVNSLAFSPDGAWLATASSDGTARIFDACNGRETVRLEGHDGPVGGLVFSPGGARVATVSDDLTARLWDAATGRGVARLPVGAAAYAVAFSVDGRIAVGDDAGRWHLLEVIG